MTYQLTTTSDLSINTLLTEIHGSLEHLHQDYILHMTLKQNSTTLIYPTPKVLSLKKPVLNLLHFIKLPLNPSNLLGIQEG